MDELHETLTQAGVDAFPVDFNPDGGRIAAMMTSHGAMLLAYEDAAAAEQDRDFIVEAARDGILEGTPFDWDDETELQALAQQLVRTSANGRVLAQLPLGFEDDAVVPDSSEQTQALLDALRRC